MTLRRLTIASVLLLPLFAAAVVAGAGDARAGTDKPSQPLPGFSFADCTPITGDSLAVPVTWKQQPLSSVRANALRLEFSLRDARLYSFELN